jgi:hypothetical protein
MEHRLLLNLATTAVLLLSTTALIFHIVQLILYSEYATNVSSISGVISILSCHQRTMAFCKLQAGIPGILSTGYKPVSGTIAVRERRELITDAFLF